MVRRLFKLKKSECSEEKLKVIWCALDTDSSDTIQQVEFGRFIKLANAKRPSAPDANQLTPRAHVASRPPTTRPSTASPRVQKIVWTKPDNWNSFGWAPTTAETNYLGGPWSPRGLKHLNNPALSLSRARTPRSSHRANPLPQLPDISSRPGSAQFRWPYTLQQPQAPVWRVSSRPGTARSSRPGTASSNRPWLQPPQ